MTAATAGVAVAAVDEIELTLKTAGTRTVKVPRDGYEAAKKDKSLPWFLDTWISNIEQDYTVTEPDGTCYNPYWEY